MIDVSIICLYLISTLGIGLYYGRGVKTLKEFLISEREFPDSVMLATLFATVIGAGSTCGIVSNVYQFGIIFMFAFYGAALNKFIIAKYIAHKIKLYEKAQSLGDVFATEYGQYGRIIAGLGTVFVTVVTLGQQILAIGLVFYEFFGISVHFGIILGFGTVVIYSAFGGIRAVVMTDVYQFIFIMAFVPIILISTINYIGGIDVFYNHMTAKLVLFPENNAITLKAFTLFIVMGFASLDPSMIQRVILAKSNEQVVYIFKTTGYLSLFLFTAMGILGLAVSFQGIDVKPSAALPYLINNTLPIVLRGVAISAILAIIMSSADSDLHVVSSSTVKDLILPFFKNLSDRQQTNCAKVLTVFIGTGGAVIALLFDNIFDMLIFAFGFWGPSILVPFLFLIFGKAIQTRSMIFLVITTQTLVIGWNLFLKNSLLVDGLIPGMLYAIILYYVLFYNMNAKSPTLATA